MNPAPSTRLSRPGSPSPRTLSLLLACTALHLSAAEPESPPTPFRIGFTDTLFVSVDKNDALASIRAWSQSLAHQANILADPQPRIFDSAEKLAEALDRGEVDAVNMTVDRYWSIRDRVKLAFPYISENAGAATEEFVLLVHRNSGLNRVDQLKGRKVSLLDGHRTRLGIVWFETLLLESVHQPAAAFCGSVTRQTKPNQAVLPVFFGKIDACVTSRHGFRLMAELNPQLEAQLVPIATSGPMVPVVFAFRAGFDSPIAAQLRSQVGGWHANPAGRQILTIFQTERIREGSFDMLESACELLERHRRLLAQTLPAGPTPAAQPRRRPPFPRPSPVPRRRRVPLPRRSHPNPLPLVALLLLLTAPGPVPSASGADPGPGNTFAIRFALTRTMLPDVNETDAKAAMRVYASTVASGEGVAADPNIQILESTQEIADAVRANRVQLVAMSVTEYVHLDPTLFFPRYLYAIYGTSLDEEYLLLTRSDSGAKTFDALGGKTLRVHRSARTPLALPWLDVQLARHRLPPHARHFGRTLEVTKPSQALLPVFFRQADADACLMTRRAFEVLSELNPQVTQRLRIVSASTGFVPTITCLAAQIPPALADRVFAGATNMHRLPAGRQIFTLFQSETVVVRDATPIASARTLLEEHHRLLAAPTAPIPADTHANPLP